MDNTVGDGHDLRHLHDRVLRVRCILRGHVDDGMASQLLIQPADQVLEQMRIVHA
jgi:hypothetical protein